MITGHVDQADIGGLVRALKGMEQKLPRNLSKVINATAKKTNTRMKGQLTGVANVKTTEITKRKRLSITRRATARRLGATVTLRKSSRLSLKAFKNTRQNRKGVQYEIQKGQGQTVLHGFMGPKPGRRAVKLNGHAFIRVGKQRKPIVKLHGASPWAMYRGNKLDLKLAPLVAREFETAVDRHIRALTLGYAKA